MASFNGTPNAHVHAWMSSMKAAQYWARVLLPSSIRDSGPPPVWSERHREMDTTRDAELRTAFGHDGRIVLVTRCQQR
jgi:hypothetical protein